MKTKILWLGLILCYTAQLSAMDRPSLYDPLGVLSVEEKNRIDAEGRTIISNRKVKGQSLLIQIDFLSKDEFNEKGTTGRTESGRTLFSLNTYSSWSMGYSSQPAVLMLFIDQGNNNYTLDALNFSDMLMDEGIPDLVRRYIRDEIMKKETSYVETISSGLYAIGEALNPLYRQRLEQKGNEMLNTDNRYQRAHCNHWSDCKYYEYYPIERLYSSFSDNIDLNELGFFIERPSGYEVTAYVDSTQQKILDWGHTHTSEMVSNWPWENKGKYLKTSANTAGYSIPNDYFPLKDNGDTLSFFDVNEEQKRIGEVLPVMGYLQIYGWKATYCNFFAYDLSRHVFGYVPWGAPKRANEIHDYFLAVSSFIEIDPISLPQLIDADYIIYATTNKYPNPGHIATLWSSDLNVIQAGGTTGVMNISQAFGSRDVIYFHLYLGFLHKKI